MVDELSRSTMLSWYLLRKYYASTDSSHHFPSFHRIIFQSLTRKLPGPGPTAIAAGGPRAAAESWSRGVLFGMPDIRPFSNQQLLAPLRFKNTVTLVACCVGPQLEQDRCSVLTGRLVPPRPPAVTPKRSMGCCQFDKKSGSGPSYGRACAVHTQSRNTIVIVL